MKKLIRHLFKQQKFTLIELIVVIVILGILAAIVVPNISSWQKEAEYTAIQSNVRNLQTSVDMYALDSHGSLPGIQKPELGIPQPLDYSKLKPEHLRDIPKTKKINYWVDSNGKVWASTIDSPTGVKNDGTLLKWLEEEEAAEYGIYVDNIKTTGATQTSSAQLNKITTVSKEDFIKNGGYTTGDNRTYYVSAVDSNGFETPPAKEGYTGYDSYTATTEEPPAPPAPKILVGYTENVIPTMTSSTSPTGKVEASSYNTYWNTLPYTVFDKTSKQWATPDGTRHGWISYEFPSERKIEKYTITATSNDPYNLNGAPNTWTFEGWDENQAKWVELDRRTGQTGWKYSEKRDFTFSSNQSFKKYRLNVTNNNGHVFLIFQELEMMEGIYE